MARRKRRAAPMADLFNGEEGIRSSDYGVIEREPMSGIF
jgi:hypothetical protein